MDHPGERQRFDGVQVPDPGFPDDIGAVAPEVEAALTAYAEDRSRYVDALNAVAGSRLLVPVVAVLGEVEHDPEPGAGPARDKSSEMPVSSSERVEMPVSSSERSERVEMAAVLLTGADGRLALLAFTGTEPLARWRADARPVPVTARQAALAAVQEEAAALVVDVAGPVPFVVEGPTLRSLAGAGTP